MYINSRQSAADRGARGTILDVLRKDACWFWLSLTAPSSVLLVKYIGWPGTIAYAAIAAAVIAYAPLGLRSMTDRTATVLAAATFVVVVIIFALVYPAVNAQIVGVGSDDDDALMLGARALLAGRTPYDQSTYLGNPLHHLPGAFVLAAPFVALGTSALQNLFWLPLFFVVVAVELRDRGLALKYGWMVLALSPAVLWEVATGTGYLTNAISIVLATWLLIRTRRRKLAAILWGVTLASRANFFFIVPIVFGWLRRRVGWRAAAQTVALACLTSAALTVPFYLHNPHNFGPLEAADRVFRFDGMLPHFGAGVLLLMAGLSIGLSWSTTSRASLFGNSALVLAVPVGAGIVLASLAERRIDLWYARYGAFFAWFALMAGFCGISGKREQSLRDQLVDEAEQVGF